MQSQFRMVRDIEAAAVDWGSLRWFSHPASTGASQLVVLDGIVAPGKGHDFHKHDTQEEFIVVIEGEVEQWLHNDKRILRPGDAVFVAPGVVHATFNVGRDDARVLAVFGPCVGDGFETVDVSQEEPWRRLRAAAA